MTLMDFAIRLLVGFFLGVGIGIERQWLKSRAVLKTNVLVTLGAAIFVMLSIMTPGDASPTRISAQVVSGIGFLGGGVILKEGASVRGTNTAATLWCAAAIGTLVGSGHLIQAYLGTFAVVSANLLLRPLVDAFKQQEREEIEYQDSAYWDNQSEEPILSSKTAKKSLIAQQLTNSQNNLPSESPLAQNKARETCYSCHLTCLAAQEVQVLTVLLQSVKEQGWHLKQLNSKNILSDRDSQQPEIVEIQADFLSKDLYYDLEQIEDVVSTLKSDVTVSSIRWQFYT
jgi:putative Mg2+ transporter-C (MgtC) family protein